MNELDLHNMKNRSDKRMTKMKKSKDGKQEDNFFETHTHEHQQSRLKDMLSNLIKIIIVLAVIYRFAGLIFLGISAIIITAIVLLKPLKEHLKNRQLKDEWDD
jgi:ABC-type transport system involved in cytochrome bd biosynthesis fused ATPase/permease subunit